MESNQDNRSLPRIAIVHDALCVSGGAEKVALWMSRAFPGAPIFTSVYLSDQTFPDFKNLDVRTLPFSKWIKTEKQFKLLFPLWLLELRKLSFSEFDIVLSSSTYLAKYIQPGSRAVHKAYIHAPFRLLWKPESYTPESLPTGRAATLLVKAILPAMRRWDVAETKRIPTIATNSRNMATEIQHIYGKTSEVIHPPVDVSEYPISSGSGGYYLTVSRLISHKKVDLAIQACNKLGRQLVVVGDGPERKKLEQMAGSTVRFTGRVFDNELKELYAGAKAFLFPSYEDFGIVPVEAQACGTPVIAFGRGGILETVIPGETGVFFDAQTVESVIHGIEAFEKTNYSSTRIRQWAMNFDITIFNGAIKRFVNTL